MRRLSMVRWAFTLGAALFMSVGAAASSSKTPVAHVIHVMRQSADKSNWEMWMMLAVAVATVAYPLRRQQRSLESPRPLAS